MSFQEIDRAQVLAEALPYIQRFSGKTIIVKYDSSAVPGEARDAAISDMILLSLVGVRVVLLHSGRTEIDAMLEKVSRGWKLSRMGKVELTILRLAVYEMRFDEDIPEKVAINEAVELSKKFGGDDSPAFINGVLAKLTGQ